MRRPVVSVALAGGVLLLAAVPYFSINEGYSGVSTLPDEADSKQAFLVLEREFSGGLGSPVEIVIDGEITPSVSASIDDLQGTLAGDGAFGPSEVAVNEAGDLALVSSPLAGDMAGDDALDTVRGLREQVVPELFEGQPVDVLVGGDTATNLDYLSQTTRYTPLVFLFVLGSSFLLLMIAFRSLVIPAKAIAMNLLSVGAAYGLVVLFFQQGVGPEVFKDLASLLGFGQVEAIEAGLPLFWFCILFGLSMDYHVFLLSRIRERFDQTGDNAGSVAYGLRTTGALITGAAAIMVAVFAGFTVGPLVPLQQMGFGLAVAVALDATIVRIVLVPATMKLLGKRNWYLPSWLEWLPNVHIEGERVAEAAPEREDRAGRPGLHRPGRGHRMRRMADRTERQLELLRRMSDLDPPPFIMGGYAEDALIGGTVSREHEDVDWFLPRSELDDRLDQARGLGFPSSRPGASRRRGTPSISPRRKGSSRSTSASATRSAATT